MPDERIPLTVGLKVTQIVQETSPVRAMYIMGENPILSDPEVSHAEHWFRELEFLAVQDLFLTETARYADVVLPGASFAAFPRTSFVVPPSCMRRARGQRRCGRWG